MGSTIALSPLLGGRTRIEVALAGDAYTNISEVRMSPKRDPHMSIRLCGLDRNGYHNCPERNSMLIIYILLD